MRTFIAFAAGVVVGLFCVAAFANASATVLPIFGGGTGTGAIPSYGNILVGNASSGYTLTATSSLGLTGASLSAANTWTALQLFSKNASSSQESCFGPCYFGGTATSTFSSAGVLSLTSALAVSSGGTGLTSTSQNWAFMGPTSGSGAPAFRAIVAADIPTLNQNTSGTAAGLSATLAIGSGGTNAASFGTSGGVVAYNGTSLVNFSAFTLTSTLLTASNASTTSLTVNLTNVEGDGSGSDYITPTRSFSATYATSTTWTGSTSVLDIGIAPFGMTITTARCHTDAGTLNVQLQYGTGPTKPAMLLASSTIGAQTLSSNNTPAKGNDVEIVFGTPASSPTEANCTFSGPQTGT
jgi:hypothetical protein